MAQPYSADMYVQRCSDSERYQLRSAVRWELVVPPAEQLSDIDVSSTLVHLDGIHSRIRFETLALHLISF